MMTSFGRDMLLVVLCIACTFIGLWGGAKVNGANAERELKFAVANAIAHTLETTRTPLNCKDNEIIEALKVMAENKAHVKNYNLYLTISNEEELDDGRRHTDNKVDGVR